MEWVSETLTINKPIKNDNGLVTGLEICSGHLTEFGAIQNKKVVPETEPDT